MKKHIPILILLLLSITSTSAQTFSDDNFVYTASPKRGVQTTEFSTLTKEEIHQNVTYFDGLGRPIQTIAIGQGGAGQDIITPIEYDGFGRQVKDYLPYAAANGGTNYSKIDPAAAINAAVLFYNTVKYENTTNPFSEKKLEASPLNRVLKQAAPGTSWKMENGHEIKLDYQTNTAADAVKLYKAITTWQAGSGLYEISFSGQGYYNDKELYKNVTFDENSAANPIESLGSTVEFKNKQGQVILKRSYGTVGAGTTNEKHDTYYVYDIYGNLTFVIPPKAAELIGSATATQADLTSAATVTPGTPLNLAATNSIRLLPGFYAPAGSTFSAVIDSGNQSVLENLCYQYKYDDRNRLVEKKLPGKQWEFIVYDKLDRPVATGPAFSPFKDDTTIGWLITKYDAFSRPVYTGWINTTAATTTGRTALQTAQNTATLLFESKQTSGTIDGIAVNYSNTIAPTSFKLLTVNYYDDYAYPNAPAPPAKIEQETVLANAKGMATGNWTRVVTTILATLGETSTTFYDTKARPVATRIQNYLGGYTDTDSKLDFAGKTTYSITRHKRVAASTELTTKDTFTYTPQDRLLTQTHQINAGAIETIASNTYDELGQLMAKKVGNNTQNINYTYNVRGWLTGINEVNALTQSGDPIDLFAFKINYNAPQIVTPNVVGLFNGNISETVWKTGSDAVNRGYGYSYDNLNRLKNAVYQKNGSVTNAYDENLNYDKNGNIIFLTRRGDSDTASGSEIDKLVYTYQTNSNQLDNVLDNTPSTSGFNDLNKTGSDYSYDANGNMITDKNKNITDISYNQLNLPKKITFGTTGSIEYIYNAVGQKLEKNVNQGGTITSTNYLGGFQYKSKILEFFPTAEGYVKNTNGTLSYIYQYKDHLGNIRLSYAKNAGNVLEIVEENNYYPFGLKHEGYNTAVTSTNQASKYKYNGKEFQDEMGLGFYDYGFRNFDPALGRWFNVDPYAEVADDETPYQYVHNNPVIYIDPKGLVGEISDNNGFATKYTDRRGNVLLDTNDGSDDVIVVPDAQLKDFKDLIDVTPSSMSDRVDWNENMKAKFLGFKTVDDMNHLLGGFTRQWSRQNAINYIQNPTYANALAMSFSEALSQWSDPQQLLAMASMLASIPSPEGIIYLRTDRTLGLKPYAGQAKSEARYLARQAEHARAHPDADFEFKIIDRGSTSGKFPTSLDRKEQQALDRLNGPTNKSNPNGGASNKKNVINK